MSKIPAAAGYPTPTVSRCRSWKTLSGYHHHHRALSTTPPPSSPPPTMLEIEELPPSAWSSMASAPLQGEFEDAPEDYSAHSDSSSDSSVREGLQRLWPRGARKRSHSESGGEESESESEGGRRKVQAVAGEEVEVFMMEL